MVPRGQDWRDDLVSLYRRKAGFCSWSLVSSCWARSSGAEVHIAVAAHGCGAGALGFDWQRGRATHTAKGYVPVEDASTAASGSAS